MTAAPLLHFATSNPHKAAEVEDLLGSTVQRLDLPIVEIQATSVEEIVRAKLEIARQHAAPFVAVEDVSLELEGLGGFPGPYVKWLLARAGGEGLGRIASGLPNRSATARCIVGLWNGAETRLVEGSVKGEVLAHPRGATTFGWDAWFLPENSSRTYGEMSLGEKSRVSHRARAWKSVRSLLVTPGGERENAPPETSP